MPLFSSSISADSPIGPLLAPLRDLRRRVLLHRRGLAALCATAAVLICLHAVRPPAPATVPVWVAAHDLDAGRALVASDLRRASYSPGTVPGSAVHDPGRLLGHALILPVAAGQPLAADQVLGSAALAAFPGRAAVAVRIADRDAARLMRPGDRIDLWATDPRAGGPARLLVAGAITLDQAAQGDNGVAGAGAGTAAGALVVLAVPRADVPAVAAATNIDYLTVVWNR